MKVFENKAIQNYKGVPMIAPTAENPKAELDLKGALWAILNNLQLKTMNDSIQGMRLAQSLDKATDKIELEDGVHDWLKGKAEDVIPALFRINAPIVHDLIKEGFER